MRITHDDIQRMRRAQSEILDGRKVRPGDFYLEKSICTYIDPSTGERTYGEKEEQMAQPGVEVLKGDEHEIIVGGMELNAGDIICTFRHTVEIPTDEPDEVGGYCYLRVKYLGNWYVITRVWPKGMGYRANRKVLFASRET